MDRPASIKAAIVRLCNEVYLDHLTPPSSTCHPIHVLNIRPPSVCAYATCDHLAVDHIEMVGLEREPAVVGQSSVSLLAVWARASLFVDVVDLQLEIAW